VRCPKCEHEQPDGALECVRCGIVFAKWHDGWEGQAPSAWAPPPAAAPAAAPASSGSRSVLKIAGLVGAALGWAWFFFWAPGGLQVAAEAYRDAANGFALSVPEGWQASKTNECRTATSGLSEATFCMVLEVRREADKNRSGPTVQLTTVPVGALFKTGFRGSVHIDEGDGESFADAIQKGFGASIPGFTIDSTEVVELDRIPSLRVRGSATIKGTPISVGGKAMTLPSLMGKTPEYQVSVNLAMVPSGSRAYFLVAGSEARDEPALTPAFDQIAQSFRVTGGRTTPFQRFGGLMGSIPGDAILGFLVAFTLALLRI
jgi:hypothetical protein